MSSLDLALHTLHTLRKTNADTKLMGQVNEGDVSGEANVSDTVVLCLRGALCCTQPVFGISTDVAHYLDKVFLSVQLFIDRLPPDDVSFSFRKVSRRAFQ